MTQQVVVVVVVEEGAGVSRHLHTEDRVVHLHTLQQGNIPDRVLALRFHLRSETLIGISMKDYDSDSVARSVDFDHVWICPEAMYLLDFDYCM
jgi:hypothetical protein